MTFDLTDDPPTLGHAGIIDGLDLGGALPAFEVTPALIVVTAGPEQLVAYQNPASAAMIGRRQLGVPAADALPDLAEWVRPLSPVYESGDPLVFSDLGLTRHDPGGTLRRISFDAAYAPVRDRRGMVVGVCAQAVEIIGSDLATDRYRRASLLERASHDLSQSLELDEVTTSVTRIASNLFRGWSVLDLWREDGTIERMAGAHFDPDAQRHLDRLLLYPAITGRLRGTEAISTQVARHGRTAAGHLDRLALERVACDPVHAAALRALQPEAFVTVAVRAGARVLGALTMIRSAGMEPFSTAEILIAEEFGQRAGMALSHAQAYDEQRRAVLTLQHTTLHSAPVSRAGLEVEVRYRAASRGTDIGGDWYDVFALDDGTVGVVVGDVEGHDLAAAAVMTQVRSVVHSQAKAGLPPASVCQHANRFVADLTGERLVVMSYLQLHPDEHLAVLARAGHMPVLCVGGGRVATWRGRGGMPLGVATEEVWREQAFRLPDPCLLALFTDGLVESPGRSVEEGIARLGAILEGHGDLPLDEIADLAVADLAGEGTGDDVALVLLRLESVGAPDAAEGEQLRVVRSLPPAASSASLARSFVNDLLPAWGVGEEAGFTVASLVSELVANAARHSDGPVELRITGGRPLRVEVFDDSHRMPILRRPNDDESSGRGLQMVDALADCWGVDIEEGGKVVWFEVSDHG